VIVLADHADLTGVAVRGSSPLLLLDGRTERLDAVAASLAGAHPALSVWRREDRPAAVHLATSERIAPLVCLAAEGWYVAPRRGRGPVLPKGGGAHGYDHRAPSMRSLFVAHGPSFVAGRVVPPVESVDLYPLMARILGLDPAPNDGRLERVRHLLREGSGGAPR
jgi:predicted AlkP superfamily pyrophosphatase or phosphodiesterase